MADSIDDLMGRWHDFADQPPPELEKGFSESSRSLVYEVLNQALGATHVESFDTPRQFAAYVLELRSNERAWSRRLGEVILEAQDHLDRGDRLAAEKAFESFESDCPWRVFAEIAKTQRENTLG